MKCQMLIDGKWTDTAKGDVIQVKNPATGEPVVTVPKGTREDIGRAVTAAHKAQPAFAKMTVFDRGKICHKIADVITARREALGKLLTQEQGKPYKAEALGEIDFTAKLFHMAAEDAARLEGSILPSEEGRKRIFCLRQPRGVYGVITPWNFPMAIPAEYLSAALATGNTVVWVPAMTAGCAVKLAECLVEAGVPPGVVNLVTGEGAEVGDEVAGHAGIDAVGFTGSSHNGLAVSRRAAGKPQLLELGGNAPTIVLADVDITRAAGIIGRGAFWNAGQICDSTERILVPRSIRKQFVDELVKIAGEFKLGNPLDDKINLGPVHNERQAQHVNRHLQDAIKKGARVVAGGDAGKGFPTPLFIPATVIDGVKPDMLLNLEETFGPVAPVLEFENEEEALAIANSSPTGLVASLFTNDLGKAFRIGERMQAGIININEGSAYWQAHIPFGGCSGKNSGVGRLGGKHTVLEMTQIKTLVVDVGE